MNWIYRNYKLFNYGIVFWKRKTTTMIEQRRFHSRYQLYQASSDLLHIRVKARDLVHTGLQSTFVITLSNDLRRDQDNEIQTDILNNESHTNGDDLVALSKEEFDTIKTFLIVAGFKNMLESDVSAMKRIRLDKTDTELQYDFVVKKEDLKEEDRFVFDLAILALVKKKSKTIYIKETQPLSLQTIENTDRVLFTDGDINLKVIVNTYLYMEKDVKFRSINQLCNREERFISNRKSTVFKNMRDKIGLKHLLQHTADTPNIAIIGSGGGMRAAVGMCGALTGLQENGIHECAMYTAGLSGSAWYLLILYGYDKQHDPKGIEDIILQKILNFHTLRTWKVSPKWFSFSDSFGDVMGELLSAMKQSKHCWSDQTIKLADGSAPLPLINALHSHNKKTKKDCYEWIEFSPYEVSIPNYGAAIDMRYFGDQFYGGFAIVENRGRCIKDLQVRDWYSSWNGIKDRIACLFNAVEYHSIGKVPNFLSGMPEFTPLFGYAKEGEKTNILDVKKEDMWIIDAISTMNSPYPTVLHPSRQVDVIISFDFTERADDESWPFKELEKAEKWANDKCVPFPQLNPQLEKIKTDWEQGIYEEVYVFSGDNSPTIVHFVLLSKESLKRKKPDEADKKLKIFPAYRTKKFKYDEQEIHQLKSLVFNNVMRNEKTIIKCIEDAIERNINKRRKGNEFLKL